MEVKSYKQVTDSTLVAWNNKTIHLGLLDDTYEFDSNHSNIDLIGYMTYQVKLETSQITHDLSIIFDAQDIHEDDVSIRLSKYLVIYDTQKGPLFLFDGVTGLPVEVSKSLSIKFSDNYHKVFSYNILEKQYSFGTIFVSGTQKEFYSDPRQSGGYQSRSGIPGSYVEEVDKSTLSGKNSLYRDLSVSGKPHPLTGDLMTVTSVSAINQSIRNILLSDTYERPFSSQHVAANIRKYIFEINDEITRDSVSREVMTALQNYEPRITVLGIKVDSFEHDYSMSISIAYKIKTSNIHGETTVYLKRA